MKNIYALSLLLTISSTAFSMHTHRSLIKIDKKRPYLVTLKPLDSVKGRREAYQKYCPTKISWNKADQEPKKEFTTYTSTTKNHFGYWQQFIKETRS